MYTKEMLESIKMVEANRHSLCAYAHVRFWRLIKAARHKVRAACHYDTSLLPQSRSGRICFANLYSSLECSPIDGL